MKHAHLNIYFRSKQLELQQSNWVQIVRFHADQSEVVDLVLIWEGLVKFSHFKGDFRPQDMAELLEIKNSWQEVCDQSY